MVSRGGVLLVIEPTDLGNDTLGMIGGSLLQFISTTMELVLIHLFGHLTCIRTCAGSPW